MEWREIAPLIAAAAPTLGKIVGGALPIPFGYAVGENLGRTIAAALGVEPTPVSVSAAVQNIAADELKSRLAALETSAAAQYQAMAEIARADASVQIEQTRATAGTIANELVSGGLLQRNWRPIAMLTWVASWPFQLAGLFYAISTHDVAIMANLPTLVTALAAWNAAPAGLAGVYSWGRTKEKIAVAENDSNP